MVDIIKVSAKSRSTSVAGAIAGVIREHQRAEVQAIGAGAVNQAIKAVAIARGYLEREKLQLARSFCSLCDECRGQCPHGVDVPTLMRAHMYAYGYRNLELAMTTHGTLPASHGSARCAACPVCVVRCPRGVDVAGRVAGVRSFAGAYA